MAAAVPSVEELLASIPGIHKGGDGNAAPAATASEPEAQQPASKRRKGGAAKEAKADAAHAQPQPVADAAGAGAQQLHSISDAVVVTTVNCPAGCVGQVIGRGGTTIKSIQGMSGAAVQVAKEVVGSTTREVTIRGAAASVAAAHAMIQQVIAQAAAAKSGSRSGGRGGSGAPTEPRVEVRLPCAADRIGWVIGPAGATVKAIRTLSGAQLDMLEEVTETGGRRGIVVVSGTADAVSEAKTALTGLLGAPHAAASKAYAAQLLEAAEARNAWEEAQRKAAAGPAGVTSTAAEGGTAAEAGEGAAAGTAADPAAQQQQAGWRPVITKHPDGSELRYWLHEASGVVRW